MSLNKKKGYISFKFPQIDGYKIPRQVFFILQKLEERGFIAFLVGGCVRDLILRKPVHDFDLTTDANPDQLRELFQNYKILHIGKSFQTITLILDKQSFHITTFRIIEDKSNLKTIKNNKYFRLEQDLLSRDFTINSLAWNPHLGILDPAGGLRDLQEGTIHSLRPHCRFQEDPLRLLRAIRFACETNFKISSEVKKSILTKGYLINKVSRERIRDELCSIILNPELFKALKMLESYSLMKYILALDGRKKICFSTYLSLSDAFLVRKKIADDLTIRLAIWGKLSFGGSVQAKIFFIPLIENLKFKKKIISRLKILFSREWTEVAFDNSQNIRSLLSEMGIENTRDILYLKKIALLWEQDKKKLLKVGREEKLFKEELDRHPPVSREDLELDGHDLIEMGVPEGENIGKILKFLLNIVLISPEKNNREYLKSIVNKKVFP